MVIGIVAGLTLPVLMNNSNGEEFKAAFKKAVLSLKQAVRLNYVAGGLSPLKYSNNTDLINDLFKTRMNVLDVKSNPFKSSYTMTDCDFTNKGNPVCTEYTPDISNTIITQDGYIYYFVATKRADGAIPIIVDVNGQRRPNKATMNKNEPKDQYTVLLYDDIYLTAKPTRAPKEGCTEPSCYECNDPSCFCTDPSCYECTDPTCPTECTDPTCPTECSELSCLTQCSDPSCMQTPDPTCTDPSCTPDPGCTEPSCYTPPTEPTYDPTVEPTQNTTPTEPTEEPKCTPQAKPVNCIAGNYAADGCTYNCTQYCTKQSIPANCIAGSYAADGCTYNCTQTCTNQAKPANCAYGHNNADCSYTCEKWNESKPSNCLKGYNDTNGSYICSQYCTNESKPSDCEEGYNKDDCSYVCTQKKRKGCVGKSYKDKDGKIKYLNSYSSEIQGGDWYGYCMADDCDHYYAREYHICNLETEEWSNYKCLIGETNIPGACDEI